MSGLKGVLSRNSWLVIALAVALDLAMILGPPTLLNMSWGFPIFMTRWFVMMVGIWAVIWAYRDERIEFGMRYWLQMYLVFGFTISGVLSLRGTFSVFDF